MPIELLDKLNTKELQADEVVNTKIDKILAFIKEFRVVMKNSLDALEKSI